MARDNPRTIFIGDVHGCADELRDLLHKCGASSDDRVVLVGDLVAKGPDSAAVVQMAREGSFLAVRGNHDEAVLRYRRAVKSGGELPKLKPDHQQVVKTLREEDFRYLEALPLWLRFPELDTLVVHAGVVPGKPVEAQREDDLLQIRTVKKDGTGSKNLEDGELWGTLYHGPEHVVFGHNAITGLQQHPFATGLDTGCVYGRTLTALVLPERRMLSVSARRAYKELKE